MKKLFIYLLIFASFSVFSQKNGCPSKSQKNYSCGNISEDVFENILEVDYEMPTKFNVSVNHNFKRKKDILRAKEINELVSKVLNDNDFWKALRYYNNYRFSKWSKNLNDDWEVIRDKEIVNTLINGNPKNDDRPKNINLVIDLELYGWSFRKPFETSVGREGNGVVYNKKWFFRKDTLDNIGSNWIHEIAHSKGLRHCFECNEERDYSIPYVIFTNNQQL